MVTMDTLNKKEKFYTVNIQLAAGTPEADAGRLIFEEAGLLPKEHNYG